MNQIIPPGRDAAEPRLRGIGKAARVLSVTLLCVAALSAPEGGGFHERGVAGGFHGGGAVAFTKEREAAVSTVGGSPAASIAAILGAFMGEVLVVSTLADFPPGGFIPVHRRAREWTDLPAAHKRAQAATPWCFAVASTPATGSVAGGTGSGVMTRIFGRAMACMTIPTSLSPGITVRIPPATTPM